MLSFIFIILLLTAVHYCLFLLKVKRGLKKIEYKTQQRTGKIFISVIIPFRDESENLLNNLKSIESQTYPKNNFEVIYVNDSSEDNSLDIINSAVRSENIRVISVPDDFASNAHKKRAVRYGIENSIGDIIVTTDADCFHPKEWLAEMSAMFDDQTGFVSGPVRFADEKTIFGKLQQIEFAGLVLSGAGLIGSGSPAICNAANIAYRRKVFKETGGFNDQMNLSSGDDELLMQKIHRNTGYKIRFCWNKKALVMTGANKSVNQFYQQRKRWASKGLFYADKLLILRLILIFLFYISLPIELLFTLTWNFIFIYSFLIAAGSKIMLEYFIMKKGADFLFESGIFKYFYLAEVLHIPYIIIAGISGLFGNFTWKKRKVKR